jgi:hypothetical protein
VTRSDTAVQRGVLAQRKRSVPNSATSEVKERRVAENLYPLQKGRDGSGFGCHSTWLGEQQSVGRRRSPFYLLRLRFRRGISASAVVIFRSGVSLKRVASNAAFYMIDISAPPVTFC